MAKRGRPKKKAEKVEEISEAYRKSYKLFRIRDRINEQIKRNRKTLTENDILTKYYWDFTCSYEIKRSQSKLFDSRENANRWLESIMKNGG